MRKIYFLFILISVTLTAKAQAPTFKKQLPKVDAYVQQLMKDWKVAGSAVAIVYKDQVIFSKGYGYRDVENKLPVTTKTLFGIASNTKLFTSMAAAMLHEEKKLDLDKPVRTYMPELRFATGELDEKLTLRDMLSHRSGVPRWDGVWAGSGYTMQEILDRLQYMKPTLGFREGYLYNNNMYAAAGAVLGKVDGSSWDKVISKKIFEPLGMTRSYFTFEDAEKAGEFAKDYYNTRLDSVMKPYPADVHCDCWAPAANIVSNVEDLSNWMISQINGGKFKGKKVIPAKAIAETIKPNNITSKEITYDEIFYGLYGMGRISTDYKGHISVSHGGVISGYRSTIAMLPKDSIGVIVLTNTAQGSPMAAAAVNGIYDRLLQLDESPWTAKIRKEGRKNATRTWRGIDSLKALQVKNTKPSHALQDYVGIYENPVYGKIEITMPGDKLQMKFRIWTEPLEHFHYDQFWSPIYPDYTIAYSIYLFKLGFLTNEAGILDRIQTRIGDDPTVIFTRAKPKG
ncbi:MAG: serine hydrolase [Cyclobacteriaceae bacterium]|nr:serine hydrolase [Cyclobacteriaceae bacterium]